MAAHWTGRSWRRAALLTAGLVALAGCGDSSEYELAPVSGVVTLNGAVVPFTQVVFVPKGGEGKQNPGPGSTAYCDASGRYEMKTVRGEPGAVVGDHAVQIYAHGDPSKMSTSSDTGPPPKELFPPQFNAQSTLTFTVPADGTTTADFKLTSP